MTIRDRNPAYDSTPNRDDALKRFNKDCLTGDGGRSLTRAELKDLVDAKLIEGRRATYGRDSEISYNLTYVGNARLNNIAAEAAQKLSAAKIRQFVVDLQSHLHALGGAAEIDTNGSTFGEYLRCFDEYSWRHQISIRDPENQVSTRVEIKERGVAGNGYSGVSMPIPKGVFDVLAGGYGGQRFGSRKGVLPAAEIAAWVDARIKKSIEQKLGDEVTRRVVEAQQERIDALHRELEIKVDDGKWNYDPGRAHLTVADDGEHFQLVLEEKDLTFEQAEQLLRFCAELGL